MARLGLRVHLVAAFVGVAALAVAVASLLSGWGLHRSFDDYLDQRTARATEQALSLTESAYRGSDGRWTADSLDVLAHELVLTGYDYRLRDSRRVLLDTTKLDRPQLDFRRVARVPVRDGAGAPVATLELYALGASGNMPADDQLRRELDRSHLIAALIAGLVAIVAGLVVAGRLSGPLRRLAGAARQLARGERAAIDSPRASSEIAELAAALNGLASDLERQRRSRRQLAQDLSHELRTPLMLLQSRIEAMQDGVVPFDEGQLATLHAETLRLSRLIDQIERLAEAEAEPPPLLPREVPLDALAREVCEALEAAFEARGLALELDARPVVARADDDTLRQIATNLLSNALKYAPEGQPVRVSTGPEDGWAVLRISDGGEDLRQEGDHLFERFHRGSGAATRSAGQGLGLTIARGLAERNGGRLELEPCDRGTCFVLRVPVAGQPQPGTG